jgi:hypothetical protein
MTQALKLKYACYFLSSAFIILRTGTNKYETYIYEIFEQHKHV